MRNIDIILFVHWRPAAYPPTLSTILTGTKCNAVLMTFSLKTLVKLFDVDAFVHKHSTLSERVWIYAAGVDTASEVGNSNRTVAQAITLHIS